MRVAPLLSAAVAVSLCAAPAGLQAQGNFSAGEVHWLQKIGESLDRAEAARQAGECDDYDFMARAARALLVHARSLGIFSDEYSQRLDRRVSRSLSRPCPPVPGEIEVAQFPPDDLAPPDSRGVEVLEQMLKDASRVDSQHFEAAQRCDRAAMELYRRQLDELAAQARNVVAKMPRETLSNIDDIKRASQIAASIQAYARHAGARQPRNCPDLVGSKQTTGGSAGTGTTGTSATTGSISAPADPVVVPRSTGGAALVVPVRGMAGTYRLVSSTGATSELTIAEAGGRMMLMGAGQPIPLEQQGDTFVGAGATLFGRSNLQVQVRMSGGAPQLTATDTQGQTYTLPLTIVEPNQ